MMPTAPSIRRDAPTPEEIRQEVDALDPLVAQAHVNGDRARLCSTRIYERIRLGDQIIDLRQARYNASTGRWSDEGCHAALYCRVSSLRQAGRVVGQDGYSVEQQITSGARHFALRATNAGADAGEAFAVYSDVGLSGGLAHYDPTIIRRLAQQKASYYEEAFRSVFFGPYAPYTEVQRQGLERYLKDRIAEEMSGTKIDRDLETEQDVDWQGRRGKASYRPGLTVLLSRLGVIHTVGVGDVSRLARSEYLVSEVARLLDQADTEIVGTLESLDWLLRRDFGSRTISFVLSLLAEMKLREVRINNLKGIQAKLHAGTPFGWLPFWWTRNEQEQATETVVKNYKSTGKRRQGDLRMTRVARYIVRLYLYGGMGLKQISDTLQRRSIPAPRELTWGDKEGTPKGTPTRGINWSKTGVGDILDSRALIGEHTCFGIGWKGILPRRIIADSTWALLRERRDERKLTIHTWNIHGGEPQHLTTGLLECVCGRSMIYHSRTNKVTPRHNSSDQYVCASYRRGSATGSSDHQVTILAPQIEGFLDKLFALYPEVVLKTYASSRQRDELARVAARKVEELEEARRARRANETEAERKARDYAEMLAADTGESTEAEFESFKRKFLAKFLREEERIQRELDDIRHKEATLPEVNRDTIEQTLAIWASLSISQKNAAIKTLIRTIRLSYDTRAPDTLAYFTPITNTYEGLPLPPIRVKVTVYKDGVGRRHRIEPIEDWIDRALTPVEPQAPEDARA